MGHAWSQFTCGIDGCGGGSKIKVRSLIPEINKASTFLHLQTSRPLVSHTNLTHPGTFTAIILIFAAILVGLALVVLVIKMRRDRKMEARRTRYMDDEEWLDDEKDAVERVTMLEMLD